MYGKALYGIAKYAQETISGGIPEDHSIDLTHYVPSIILKMKDVRESYRLQGEGIGLLWYYIEDLFSQCFVETATWGLIKWEEVYGVSTNLELSYEERREILGNKIRSSGTSTVQIIKNAAEAFSGGEAEIIEEAENYRFIIRFVGIKGIPRNMQALITMLEDIKPAHLAYDFEYSYTAWEDLVPYTWEEIGTYTWSGIRSMKTTGNGKENWGSLKSDTYGELFWRTWEDLKY